MWSKMKVIITVTMAKIRSTGFHPGPCPQRSGHANSGSRSRDGAGTTNDLWGRRGPAEGSRPGEPPLAGAGWRATVLYCLYSLQPVYQ